MFPFITEVPAPAIRAVTGVLLLVTAAWIYVPSPAADSVRSALLAAYAVRRDLRLFHELPR